MIDIVGWAGSALLVFSLLQTRVLRFRVLNLVAALILIAYNAWVSVWPMAAMNLVIAVINAYYIARLVRGRHDDRRYDVVPIDPDQPYVAYLVDRYRADIDRFIPGAADGPPEGPGRLAFLVLTDGETIGLVTAHRTGPDEARVDLDYVLPRFRDFTPGEFVFRPDGPFQQAGIRRVLAPEHIRDADEYLSRVGFVQHGDDRVLTLA
jgi:hypothetical protein